VILGLDDLVLLSTVCICTSFFDINIFMILAKRAVGKKCKLRIFAPSFQMIQYTVVSLY